MSHFPKLLSSQIAYDVARTMLDGFDKHYRLFREASIEAKARFEAADWHGLQKLQRDRIAFYNDRVHEAVVTLQDEYDAERIDDEIWQQIKLHYIGLLTNHHQPELAETFFNSVCTRILHRSYFNNDFIFVRPAISTEYIENEESPVKPTYRAYYPGSREGMAACFERVVHNFQLTLPFEDLKRDIGYVLRAIDEHFGEFRTAPNFQVHTLSSLFFRNKSAFIIGRVINGDHTYPMVIPVIHGASGKLVLDTVLLRPEQLLILFSFAHAYFMVDMEIPSAYVTFLRDLLPRKARAEIYTSLGLQKQGKKPVLPRFPAPSAAFVRQVHQRTGHQGPGDAGVHAAVVSLCVQGDPRRVCAAQGDHARTGRIQIPAGQAARPRGPHGRYARIFRCGVSAVAL